MSYKKNIYKIIMIGACVRTSVVLVPLPTERAIDYTDRVTVRAQLRCHWSDVAFIALMGNIPLDLKADPDLMAFAIEQNILAAQFLAPALKEDDTYLEAVAQKLDIKLPILKFATEMNQNLPIFGIAPLIFRFVRYVQRAQSVLDTVETNVDFEAFMKVCSSKIKCNKVFMEQAARKNIRAVYYMADPLKEDRAYMLKIAELKTEYRNPELYDSVSDAVRINALNMDLEFYNRLDQIETIELKAQEKRHRLEMTIKVALHLAVYCAIYKAVPSTWPWTRLVLRLCIA